MGTVGPGVPDIEVEPGVLLWTELGGTIVRPPTDMPPGGRFARAMDPGGAQFLISSFADDE